MKNKIIRMPPFSMTAFFIVTGTLIDLMCGGDFNSTNRLFRRLCSMEPPPDYYKILDNCQGSEYKLTQLYNKPINF
jgi:hypothetical protein